MPSDRATRVSRQMCSCSARSTCLWCITTGCFVGGYPISLSVGTTWNVLRIFVHQSSALQQCTQPSPAPGSSGPSGNPRPGDGEAGSPQKARRMHGRKCETRVREEPVCEQSQLTVVQDVQELAGALVYDCRPHLLPVSIPLQNLRRSLADRSTPPSSLSAARGSDSGVR